MPDADWPGILPDVLAALEADGNLPAKTRREHGSEVRYGRPGSLRVERTRATFRDFEAGCGGGTLALVAHVAGGDERTAAAYLRDRRIRGFERRGAERPKKCRTARKRQSTCRKLNVRPCQACAACGGPDGL